MATLIKVLITRIQGTWDAIVATVGQPPSAGTETADFVHRAELTVITRRIVRLVGVGTSSRPVALVIRTLVAVIRTGDAIRFGI